MYASRLPDLSSDRVMTIWLITLALIVLVLFRAALVVGRLWRRENYPDAWTSEQLRYLQLTGGFVGIGLVMTWAALLYASPFLPPRYPFSQSNAILLIALLTQTYAWLVIAAPFNWNASPLGRLKFNYVFVGMLAWWAAFVGITLYMIVTMAVPNMFPSPPVVPSKYALASG